MARPELDAAGGLPAIRYALGKSAAAPLAMARRLRSRNACKTCALGMGGDEGGMVNEAGHFPEVCKKSIQAQASDLQDGISEEFFARTDLTALRRLDSATAERLGRLTFPIARLPGSDRFRRISWDQAMSLAADAFTDTAPGRVFFYMSGRSSNEAAFLTQLVARAYGTAHIHNCSFYCHNASSVALTAVFGSGTSSVDLNDLAAADLALVVGANPASNHPRLVSQLISLRERGGRVVAINPISELGLQRFRLPSDPGSLLRGSEVSDLIVQPRVGGDVHLLTGLLKALIARGRLETDFIANRTNGWEETAASVAEVTWEQVITGSGVTRQRIEELADTVGGAERGIAMWAMGLTHHRHGTDNILALANIALSQGWLGRPGAGLLPIRGHSNVQGVGSMGVTPQVKEAFARALEQRYGIPRPTGIGQDTYSSMTAAHAGRVDAAVLLGGNLWGSNPDSEWAAEALSRVGMTFSVATTLNPGHFHGAGHTAVVVPALARDEESQTTTQESMFNYVRFSEGGRPRPGGEQRSEVQIVADLAERILPAGRFDWAALHNHDALRRAISATVAGYGDLYRPGLPRSQRREFTVGGRIAHGEPFPTADGRARFHPVALPDVAVPEGHLLLMTIRSEGQFNTVVYDQEDLYRGNTTRDVIMISAADAAERGVTEGDSVTVTSETGSMRVQVAIIDISDGSAAMYFPEANALVDRNLDPRSGTPAFKSVPITVTPLSD